MSRGLLRAASGQQVEQQSVSGPQSYVSGAGFSIRSSLGRVDEVQVHANEDGDDQKPFDASAEVADNNAIVVTAYSQPTGVEAADDTDLSDIRFDYTASRL